jgi:HEAT repeats
MPMKKMWLVLLGILLVPALVVQAQPAAPEEDSLWQYVHASLSYALQDGRLEMVCWKWGNWTVTWSSTEQEHKAEPETEIAAEPDIPDREELAPLTLWQYVLQMWQGPPDCVTFNYGDAVSSWPCGGCGCCPRCGYCWKEPSHDPEEVRKQAEEAEARSNEFKAKERPLWKNLCLFMRPTCSFSWVLSVLRALNDPYFTWREEWSCHSCWGGLMEDPFTEEIADGLRQLLYQEDQVRLEAVKGLGRRKAYQAVDALTCMVIDDPCPAVREAAARSLGLIGTRSQRAQSALLALERAAREDNDPRVRHAAGFAAEIIQLAEE